MKFKIKKIKTKLGRKGLFACLILIILALPLVFTLHISINNKIEESNKLKTYLSVRSSATPISQIFINDTRPTNNWKAFASLHSGDSWFTNATGTEGDPYIINNVIREGSVYNIVILDSIAHFMIVNSESVGAQYNGYGIYMINVSNGILLNNNFTGNNRGMYLGNCNKNIIEGNTISHSEYNGIVFGNSHNNTIFNNMFNDNNDNGLLLWESNNNTIKSNTFKNHGHLNYDGSYVEEGAGISVKWSSYYNKIADNNFTDNKYCGIELGIDSGNTTVTENNFNNNGMCAIILDLTTNNTIRDNTMSNDGILFDGIWANMESSEISSTNLVNNKHIYFFDNKSNLYSYFFLFAGQVILTNCSNLVLSSLMLAPGSVGFTLIHCKNITLLNSEASNNKLLGIHLIDCVNVTISGCTTNNNGDCGILLENCINTKILNSEANHNDMLIRYWLQSHYYGQQIGCGIALENGLDNLIAENSVQSNNFSGISVMSSNQTISNNDFTDNSLYIEGGHNIISENTFVNSVSHIYLYQGYYSLITKNYFSRVHDAIQLEESNRNHITENIIYGDGGYGIKFRSSSYNTIERNEIYGVFKCFDEDYSSVSNVFTDNKCQTENIFFSMILYTIILLVILGAGITGVIIGKRKGRKNRE